jgi:hypothetical protein
LRLLLAPEVRATLTAWLKAYGDANQLPGLATGPLEARFHRLREHANAQETIIWTTPERRAAGDGPQIRIPALHFDLACRFADGHILAEKVSQVSPDAREPQRERGSVGIEMTVERIELPPEAEREDSLAVEIEQTFDRLTGNRWKGFVAPLREALEAEARDDAERAERLTTPYERAEPRMGGRSQENPFRLFGFPPSAIAQLEEGEWLDLLDKRGSAVATARVVSVDVGNGVLDVDTRGGDAPPGGITRPRPRAKILAQKRAILDELDSPQGNLPLLARLMASPAAMPVPRLQYPSAWFNPAVGRSRAQSRAVALALGLAEGEAMLIEGPPGTGKSTTTGEMIAQILQRDPHARILVCSHSNHGTDNMLMKVVPYVEGIESGHTKVRALELARVGMFDRVPTELRRFFVGPEDDLNDRNVVFTTIDALALNDAAGGSVYDYVVLDEANRATVLDSLVALARGKRFILVGDRLQLQPVLSEAEEQLRLEPAMARAGVIGKSLFVWVTERHFPDRAVVFLDEQNRMHPMIGGLIARAFYDDRLRNGQAAPRKDTGVPHFPHPAVWVDTRGLRGLRESRGRGPSLFNLPEARLVTTIARHLLKDAPEEMDVGVIAAYAEQVALLRRLLRNEMRQQNGRPQAPLGGALRPGRRLEIDTVDAFEGREKDVIVVSLVRSNKRREIGFLQLMQRINVALSRARRLLIVVGDTATLRGSYFDKILRYLRERGAVTPGPRVIAQLRGQPVRAEGEERRRDRFRDRDRFRRDRMEVLDPTKTPDLSTPPPPEASDLPAPMSLGEAAPDLLEELHAAQAQHQTRRPTRSRRSPEEILARLNQSVGAGAEGAAAAAKAAPGAEPAQAGAAAEADGPPAKTRRRGARRAAEAVEPAAEAVAAIDQSAAEPPPAEPAVATPRPRARRTTEQPPAPVEPVVTTPRPRARRATGRSAPEIATPTTPAAPESKPARPKALGAGRELSALPAAEAPTMNALGAPAELGVLPAPASNGTPRPRARVTRRRAESAPPPDAAT